MIASRVASRLIQTNKLSLFAQLRNNSSFIQASPPRNKLSTGELWVMGTILVAGVFGPSVYFAINMQEYNGKAEQRRKGISE